MATVIIDVQIAAEDAAKKAKELASSIKSIKDEQKELKKSGDENSAAYVQNAQQLRVLQAEQKSYIQLSQAEIGSNNQLRAQLALLTQQYNALSKEERDNTTAGKSFQTQIKALSDELKVNESAVGDNRRNVGNYKDALGGVGDALGDVSPEFSAFSGKLNSLSSIIKPAITGLNGFKIALASTGIGLIIIALGSLIAYFKSTEEGSEKLERGIAGLKGAFTAFLAPLTKIGEFLVNLFTNPLQALKDFKALLSGDLIEGVKNFGKSVSDSFNAGSNIKQLQQNAEDAGRELNRQASKLRADAAVLRAKGDAESLKQAEDFYKKADQLTQQAVNKEIDAQQKYIALLEKNGQARDSDYDKLNELYAKIDKSRQTDAAKAEKINARQEKQAEAAIKKREELAEKERAANQALLESQERVLSLTLDARKKEVQDINNDINAKVQQYKAYGKTTEQLEKERTARLKLARESFEKEDLEKLIEFQKRVQEETNKTADLEIQAIQNKSERAKAEREIANKREIEAIDKAILETAAKVLTGSANELLILEEQGKQRQAIITRQKAEDTQREIDEELNKQVALAQLKFDTAQTPEQELVARQEFLAAKTALDIENAQGNADLISEIDARAKAEQDKIDEAVMANKIARVQQFSTLFQSITGKNTLAAKIAADVSARIDAAQQLRNNVLIIQEQVKAIVSQGKLVFPLNIAAIFSTIAALAAGIASAKTLFSAPKAFATGGIFESDGFGSMINGPGSGTSDSVNAKLSNGESVINAKSTAMFKPLLSAINVAGGGRQLAPGYAMATGGIASGSFVTDISDSAQSSTDITNAIILGMQLAPAPIVDVRDVVSQAQRNERVLVNATV